MSSYPNFDVPLNEIKLPLAELQALVSGRGTIFSDIPYASLNAAVAAIGSTVATLRISTANFPDGANTTVPTTLTLEFVGAGSLNQTHTVTILSSTANYPRRPIFVGSGTVVLTGFMEVVWRATAGAGTSGSPWTGFESLLTATPGNHYHFRSGYFASSAWPNLNNYYIGFTGEGINATFLKHTAASNSIRFVAASGGWIGNLEVGGFTNIGYGSGSDIGMLFQGVNVSRVFDILLEGHQYIGLQWLGGIVNTIQNVRNPATSTCSYALDFEARAGDGFPFNDNTLINCQGEGAANYGCLITGSGSSANTIIGSTFENNAGIGLGLGVGCNNNTVIGGDHEANAGACEIEDYGHDNRYINVTVPKVGSGTGKIIFRSTAVRGIVDGGLYDTIKIESGAVDIGLVNRPNFTTLTDSGTRTYYPVRGFTALPGGHTPDDYYIHLAEKGWFESGVLVGTDTSRLLDAAWYDAVASRLSSNTFTGTQTIRKPIDSSAYGAGTRMLDFKSYYPGYDTDTVKASIYAGVSDKDTLNTQGGFLAFMVSDDGTLGEKVRIEKNGNVGIATTTFGASANRVLGIGNGTAPSSSPANMVQLWSESGELKVRDASGNVTTLSPHAQDAPAWMYDSEDLQPPNITREVNAFAGSIRFINHTRAIRLQQLLLDGKALPADPQKRKLILEETFAAYNQRCGLNSSDSGFLKAELWNANEELNNQQRDSERDQWAKEKAKHEKQAADFQKAKAGYAEKVKAWEALPAEMRARTEKPSAPEGLSKEPAEFVRPQPSKYQKRTQPAWLKARL